MRINISIITSAGDILFFSSTQSKEPPIKNREDYVSTVNFPKNIFNHGKYYIQIQAGCPGVKELLKKTTIFKFYIEKTITSGQLDQHISPGIIAPILDWEIFNC